MLSTASKRGISLALSMNSLLPSGSIPGDPSFKLSTASEAFSTLFPDEASRKYLVIAALLTIALCGLIVAAGQTATAGQKPAPVPAPEKKPAEEQKKEELWNNKNAAADDGHLALGFCATSKQTLCETLIGAVRGHRKKKPADKAG